MGLLEPSRKGDRFGTRDARGRLVLDAEAAAQLNAIRAELRRLDRFAASPPLVYSSDAAGRRWQLARPPSVYAKLTGSSSPYSWAEATRSASGVSSLVSGGRTGTAYEANSATGLGGTYATLDWTPAAGDWRFQAIRTGSGGSTPTPGFAVCCPSSTLPATINASFTFGPGKNSASYDNHYQDTTLTWSATWPSYDPGGPGAANRFFSPLLPLTDSLGSHFYYELTCNSFSGAIGVGIGVVQSDGTQFTAVSCFFISYTCSPFLAHGTSQTGTLCDGASNMIDDGGTLVIS